MKVRGIVYLLVAFALSGCDNMNYAQYKVSKVTAGSADARKVKAILQQVAAETGLKDQRSTSRLPGTAAYYIEPNVQNFRTDLGARFYGDDMLVDIVAGFGPTPDKYIQVRDLAGTSLSKQFGARISVPSPLVPIPLN